ncbi:MAG: GPW/gp25 family protein [Actinomycetia bacterium]|nr:GPW/gp25 family protein [Actinomycetes bacterium]
MSSIRHPFEIDAGLGATRTDDDRDRYIRQLMTQLLMTAPGERTNRPDFGCGVRQLVFDPASTVGATFGQIVVHQALTRWMSDLVEVHNIEVSGSENRIDLAITYQPLHRRATDVLNVGLPR